MAGTEVFYNGVLMRDCETQAFEQSLQYDSSGTDVLFSRFRIRVASTLVGLVDRDFSGEHASTIGLKEEDVAVTTVERMQELQARLQEVRKDFWYAISNSIDEGGRVPDNGKFQILLAATGEYEGNLESYFGDTGIYRKDVVDLNNGPKPLTVRISQVYSGRTLRVEFEIEVCRCLCPGEDDSSSTPPIAGALGNREVLNNRWYLSESKGEDWKTTRIITGQLRIRDLRSWDHAMRYLCIPPLLDGYKRLSQEFVSDATGLVLNYTIRDREEQAAPPPYCIDWSGAFAVTNSHVQGHMQADCSVRVVGRPGANKQVLIHQGLEVAYQRLQWRGGPTNANGAQVIPLNIAIIETLNEPIVEIRISVQLTGSNLELLAVTSDTIGKPLAFPGYSETAWPIPTPFDSNSPAGIFACYLQSPCVKWHGIAGASESLTNFDGDLQTNDSITQATREERSAQWRFYEVPAMQDSLPFRSPADLSAQQLSELAYTYVEMDDTYDLHDGIIALPLSKPRSVSIPTDSGSVTISQETTIIRLHQGIAYHHFNYAAERIGDWPTIPQPASRYLTPSGILEVMMDHKIALHNPRNGSDLQRKVYRVQGTIKYAMSRMPQLTDQLRYQGNPMTQFLASGWVNLSKIYSTT